MLTLTNLKAALNPTVSKNRQKGVTLTELLVVIGIAAVLLAIAIAIAGSVRESSRVKREIEVFQQTVSKIQSVYPNSRYTGLTTAAAQSAGAFPASSLATSTACGTNVPHNGWNGCLTVAAGTVTSTLDVGYTVVPTASCQSLLASMAPTANSYTIGTTTRTGAAMTNANIATDCATAATVSITVNSN
jgi:prepilin-type N-terminal cleavage/methylation domain-containing protein